MKEVHPQNIRFTHVFALVGVRGFTNGWGFLLPTYKVINNFN